MERKYWEKIAPDYNEEIFDVLYNDKKAIIRSVIEKQASLSKTVIDIGCAIGKWLPVLAPAFKQVMAVDISQKNLSIAKSTYPQFSNVIYKRADMSAGSPQIGRYDLAICINAILTDSLRKRQSFFRNMAASVKKGGSLVLVVPSLESWLLTRIIQQHWQIDKKLFSGKLADKEAASRYRNMQQGNVEIDNVATKHYLGEELALLLSREGLEVTLTQKIEYGWNTEFISAPAWLKEPRPWDWLVLARKK